MRDIKFRVWDKERKKMHYNVLPWQWDSVICTGSWKCIKSRDDDGSAKFEVWVQMCDGKSVMQYTGLNDKNGKEIYEGDILKEENFSIPIWVAYGLGSFETVSIVGSHSSLASCANKSIVIGNIYENPELLERL